jgi:carbonic anhydrase/acetyltransferase-like protein (isoleucine patch superfamily)
MKKKYKLLPKQLITFNCSTEESIQHEMYRIKALRDIPAHNVKAGDLGGWVNHRKVLSQEGDCWIGGGALVYNEYWMAVSGNALITDEAVVCGLADAKIRISGDAVIEGSAKVFVSSSAACRVNIYGNARLSDKAVIEDSVDITGKIGGNAVVKHSQVLGQAQVSGNAKVSSSTISDMAMVVGDAVVTNGANVSGNAVIAEEANVSAAEIRGSATISGKARVLDQSIICDSATVTGHAVILREVVIGGDSIVKDNAVVSEGTRIFGKSIIAGDTEIGAYKSYTDFISTGNRVISAAPSMDELTRTVTQPRVTASSIEGMCLKLASLEQEINAYGSDIVKLLKFPIMNDLRDENTLDMMLSLKNAKRIDPEASPDEFREAVNSLERKFMKAESNALIISSAAFSDEQRKKADKASDLFAVACNEASSEQEKKSAFKQGFRQLVGVVAVTESAIENMRIKVGIPELEA